MNNFSENEKKLGKRSDLKDACETLKTEGMEGLIGKHPSSYVKYSSGFDKLSFRIQESRVGRPRVWWLYGSTGTGKTKLVYSMERSENLWISGDDLRWFDGYEGQPAVCFDDFRGDCCKLRWLLRLLDRYPVRVQVKGSHVQWVPRRIYITSAVSPEEAYHSSDEKINQLTRRITSVINTDSVGWDNLLQFVRIG